MFGRKKKELNLLELIPERLFGYSVNDEQLVIVDMPRFHIEWMQKYLVPEAKNPYIKIKLDEFGSFVWNLCDGNRSVDEIAIILTDKFGDEIQPVYDRLSVFFKQLVNRGFVRFRTRDGLYIK